ncbi:uncharacterized protein METZ01_LOCUS459886, partial [marine metagenome]
WRLAGPRRACLRPSALFRGCTIRADAHRGCLRLFFVVAVWWV